MAQKEKKEKRNPNCKELILYQVTERIIKAHVKCFNHANRENITRDRQIKSKFSLQRHANN